MVVMRLKQRDPFITELGKSQMLTSMTQLCHAARFGDHFNYLLNSRVVDRPLGEGYPLELPTNKSKEGLTSFIIHHYIIKYIYILI